VRQTVLALIIVNCRVCRPIPELNAAEKELLSLLRRREFADKKVSAGKVQLIFYTT